MKLQKHIGRVVNTDQRIVVAYMQIPGAENYALTIPVDHMPDRLEQVVMNLLESDEGQAERDLANLLGRRMLQDSNKSVLQSLHESGFLQRLPVDNINMYPTPGTAYPLRKILEGMGKSVPATAQSDASISKDRYNAHHENLQVNASEGNYQIAKNILLQAQILIDEGVRKREEAYALVPALRPAPIQASEITEMQQAVVTNSTSAIAPTPVPPVTSAGDPTMLMQSAASSDTAVIDPALLGVTVANGTSIPATVTANNTAALTPAAPVIEPSADGSHQYLLPFGTAQ